MIKDSKRQIHSSYIYKEQYHNDIETKKDIWYLKHLLYTDFNPSKDKKDITEEDHDWDSIEPIFEKCPACEVNIKNILCYQQKLLFSEERELSGYIYPITGFKVYNSDKVILTDGHHRVAKLIEQGKNNVDIKLYDAPPDFFKRWQKDYSPKTNYYICAIIKDEQLFLNEWLDYHFSIGFDKIFLYEDFTSTSHKEITDNYENVELHSMAEIPECKEGRVGRQIAVYNHFIKEHEYGWCLFIDIDEYLRLDEGITLNYLSDNFKDKVGIEIAWKCYGANNFIKRPEGSIQKAYSPDYKENWLPYWRYKSFINLSKAYKCQQNFLNPHYHKKIVNTEHEKGDFRTDRNKLSFKLCHIDHYITKSWEDYLIRLKRGNITKGLRNINFFFEVNPNMENLKEELTRNLKQ